MKNLFCLLLLCASTIAFAQAPQQIKYQGVARDAAGAVIANGTITVKFDIHDVTPAGAIIYSETHSGVVTNQFGLFSINIGSVTPFPTNLFIGGDEFLETSVDFGAGLVSMGTSQFLSVPYAIFADSARVAGASGPMGPTGATGTSGDPGVAGANGATGAVGANGATGATGAVGANGATGTNGTNGTNGANGATGATGPSGANGVAGANGATGPTGASGTNGSNGATGPTGPQGVVGATGPSGSTLGFADFYALMPGDNAAPVCLGCDVQFPQDGPASGTSISRLTQSSFVLATIGVYNVFFQVSVSEAGQFALTLNGVVLQYTVGGRATGTSEIVGMAMVQTTSTNSVLTVRNPPGNSTALTVTPIAGGTNPVSAHLVITRVQ